MNSSEKNEEDSDHKKACQIQELAFDMGFCTDLTETTGNDERVQIPSMSEAFKGNLEEFDDGARELWGMNQQILQGLKPWQSYPGRNKYAKMFAKSIEHHKLGLTHDKFENHQLGVLLRKNGNGDGVGCYRCYGCKSDFGEEYDDDGSFFELCEGDESASIKCVLCEQTVVEASDEDGEKNVRESVDILSRHFGYCKFSPLGKDCSCGRTWSEIVDSSTRSSGFCHLENCKNKYEGENKLMIDRVKQYHKLFPEQVQTRIAGGMIGVACVKNDLDELKEIAVKQNLGEDHLEYFTGVKNLKTLYDWLHNRTKGSTILLPGMLLRVELEQLGYNRANGWYYESLPPQDAIETVVVNGETFYVKKVKQSFFNPAVSQEWKDNFREYDTNRHPEKSGRPLLCMICKKEYYERGSAKKHFDGVHNK